MNVEEKIESAGEKLAALKAEVGKVIVGNATVVEDVIAAIIAGGHVLLEGLPGLGKTVLVKTLSNALNLTFRRIQFTPDLMPADITGTNLIVEDEKGRKSFDFQRGPIFGNLILADEINRATPKTQSALLEAMAEHTVTVAGNRYDLEAPFFVLATQNPIEMEGTYPLPEAQVDRFMFKVLVKTSSLDELTEILARTTGRSVYAGATVMSRAEFLELRELAREVPTPSHLVRYVGRLTLATHPDTTECVTEVKNYIRYGASPRGAQAVLSAARVYALMAGRVNVSAEDIRRAARSAFRHRIILSFEGEAEGKKADEIIDVILDRVPDAPKEVEKMMT